MIALALLLLATDMTAPAPMPGAYGGVVPDHCMKAGARRADQDGQPARPRKLGEMPPAKRYAAVYREVDRCPVPVVLSDVPKGR